MKIPIAGVHVMLERTLKKKIEDSKGVTRKVDARMIADVLGENEQLRQEIARCCYKCRRRMNRLLSTSIPTAG